MEHVMASETETKKTIRERVQEKRKKGRSSNGRIIFIVAVFVIFLLYLITRWRCVPTSPTREHRVSL